MEKSLENGHTYTTNFSNMSERQKWLCINRIPGLIDSLYQREAIEINLTQALEILCAADPSSNHSAAQWICECYCKKGFLWEDVRDGNLSKVSDTLKLFARYKNKLTAQEKNIYTYKTLSSVYDAIEPYHKQALIEEENNQRSTVSGREQKRKEKIQALTDALVLVDQANLKAVVPLNKESAQWWGRGTRWCTASTESRNYFDHYNENAPLIILLFKDHQDNYRKLQLWFTNETLQFMDEQDQEVDYKFAQSNWQTLEPVLTFAFQTNPWFLMYYPKQQYTLENCTQAVWQDGNFLEYVPDGLKTKELCLQAISTVPAMFAYVPEQYINLEMIQDVTARCGEMLPKALEYLFEKNISKEKVQDICTNAVQNQANCIRYVPKEYKTDSMCVLACEKYSLALEYVPDELKTQELCQSALKNCSYKVLIIPHIPKKFFNYQFIVDFIEKLPNRIKYLPADCVTDEIVKHVCSLKLNAISCIPEQFLTEEICQEQVEKHWDNLKYVPDQWLTVEMCTIAFEQCPFSAEYIPEEFLPSILKNQKACLEYLRYKTDWSIWEKIDASMLDDSFYNQAFERFPRLIRQLPFEFLIQNEQLISIIYDQDPEFILNLPEEFKTDHIKEFILQAKDNPTEKKGLNRIKIINYDDDDNDYQDNDDDYQDNGLANTINGARNIQSLYTKQEPLIINWNHNGLIKEFQNHIENLKESKNQKSHQQTIIP